MRGLNNESVSTAAGLHQTTFIVFGVPRGGASKIARVDETLGVYLGSDLPTDDDDIEFNFDKLSEAT